MNIDISTLLYCLKENIRVIENGDSRDSVLDEVRSDFLDMVELMKLFLISERDSYYGYFLMNMQIKANIYSGSIAGIKLNTFPPIFEANPLLLCKFTLKEILFIICHEIDHVVLNHPAEMVKSNPTKDPDIFYEFNLAADAAVNDRINHEIESENHFFLSCPVGSITSDVLSKLYHIKYIRKMENYAYYFELIKKKAQNHNALQNGGQSMMDEQNKKEDGSSNSDSGEEKESEKTRSGETEQDSGKGEQFVGEGNVQGEDRQIITAKNCGENIQDHNWEAGDDEDDVTSAVREFVNATVEMMNGESRGLMPASFMSQVEKLNRPSVLSWQAILKKYIGTITANKRKTRMRLNRRQPDRFDLSGSMDDKVLKIVVAIDTSASVDDDMIALIFNEIFAILAKRKHDITVIECDADVQRVYKAKTPADVKMKVAGRGGTLFTPVIEFINKDKYFRDALLIYFTDGMGENEIPKPRTYRNAWVIIGDESDLSLEEPYGIVLSIDV